MEILRCFSKLLRRRIFSTAGSFRRNRSDFCDCDALSLTLQALFFLVGWWKEGTSFVYFPAIFGIDLQGFSPCRKRSPAKGVGQKSDEKSDRSVRKNDRKVTASVPKTEKKWSNSFCRTPFAAPWVFRGDLICKGFSWNWKEIGAGFYFARLVCGHWPHRFFFCNLQGCSLQWKGFCLQFGAGFCSQGRGLSGEGGSKRGGDERGEKGWARKPSVRVVAPRKWYELSLWQFPKFHSDFFRQTWPFLNANLLFVLFRPQSGRIRRKKHYVPKLRQKS